MIQGMSSGNADINNILHSRGLARSSQWHTDNVYYLADHDGILQHCTQKLKTVCYNLGSSGVWNLIIVMHLKLK